MFAARAGAKKVIGIECASIYHQAKQIIAENELSDVITLVQAKVEDITELPEGIKEVDIIISGMCRVYYRVISVVLTYIC